MTEIDRDTKMTVAAMLARRMHPKYVAIRTGADLTVVKAIEAETREDVGTIVSNKRT